MSDNLLDLAKGAIAGQAMKHIGDILGVDESLATAGVASALPAILGGLLKRASTTQGAEIVTDLLKNQDERLLRDLGTVFAAGNHQSVVDNGTGMLGTIFNSGTSGVFEAVSQASGVASGKMGSLFALLTPVVVGILAKQQKSQGLNSAGIAGLLAKQSPSLSESLTPGMGNLLGIDDYLKGDLSTPVAIQTHQPRSRKRGDMLGVFLGKLIPLVVIVVLAFLAYKWIIHREGNATPTPELNNPSSPGPVSPN